MGTLEFILIFAALTFGVYHLLAAVRETYESSQKSIESEASVITEEDRLLYAEDNEEALRAFDELLGETTEEFQSVYDAKKVFINRWAHTLARHTYMGDLEWYHGEARDVKKISGQNIGDIIAVFKTRMTLGGDRFDLILSRVKPYTTTMTELIVRRNLQHGGSQLQVWGYLDQESNVTQELWNLARENAKNGIAVQELLDVSALLEDPS